MEITKKLKTIIKELRVKKMLLDRIDKEYKGYFIEINIHHSLKELIIYYDDYLKPFYKEKFIDYSDNEILIQAKKLIENSK